MASETPPAGIPATVSTQARARGLARRATTVRRAQAAACAALVLAATIGGTLAWSSPRLLVLCALAALVALGLGLAALRPLVVPPPEPAQAQALDAAAPRRDDALRAALVEAQLDQAPVALWWQSSGAVTPLNNAARRLVAPGGATRPDELLAQLRGADAGGARQLMRFDSERGPERHLLAARTLMVDGSTHRLLAQMSIESELEAETLKAWRQLVHVLTHEIMNSLTPIASLSRTAHELLAERVPADDPDDDLAIALEAIARRAESLASFVAGYRRVSDWPEPALAAVELAPLFARLERLVGADWQGRGGAARFAVQPPTLTLMADAGQLEQVLLNLLRNAAQATAGTQAPTVHVSARLIRGGRLAIEVRDNGPGVPGGLEQDIFMPFFSTRAGGSGIGLAVVRNLVQGMGGSVRHAKPANGGAAFVLSF
jgi:signal transduction histidine kinase